MSLASILTPARVLLHPTRWRIVERLWQRPLCVSDVAGILELGQSNVSNHLKLLCEAGIVERTRSGRLSLYGVTQRFEKVFPALRESLGLTEAGDPVLEADAWNAQRASRA